MKFWPFGRRETRSGYEGLITGAIEAAAAGGSGVAAATAAVESCAGLWGRTMALIEVTPRNRRTAALTPAFLEMAGRQLARVGELVCDIDTSGGMLRLHPSAQSYVTVGSVDPRTWIYTLNLTGASDTRVVYRRRDGVVHLMYGTAPGRSWVGRAPWQGAGLSGDLIAGIERQLAGESRSASGYVLPVPDRGDQGQTGAATDAPDPMVALGNKLAAAGGKLQLAETMMSGHGAGAGLAPSHDWTPRRFGINPPPGTVELRRDVSRDIIATYGISSVMFDHAAPGGSIREAWRAALALSIQPVVELVTGHLREALDVPDLALDIKKARAADVVMLSRALGSLVNAKPDPAVGGLTVDQARAIVGL